MASRCHAMASPVVSARERDRAVTGWCPAFLFPALLPAAIQVPVPDTVVLLHPFLVHIAFKHTAEGAGNVEGAKIDMTEGNRQSQAGRTLRITLASCMVSRDCPKSGKSSTSPLILPSRTAHTAVFTGPPAEIYGHVIFRVGLCLDMLVNELLQGHGPGFGVAAVTGILDIALHAGRAQALACSRSLWCHRDRCAQGRYGHACG